MLKNLFRKTWFQIVFFGAIIGGILIIADNKFDFFNAEINKSGTYDGPVQVEKDKAYFTEVQFSETKFDFGKVKEGDTLSHVFTITNAGNEPLIIYKSVSSCDCVGTDYSKEMISAGAITKLTVYFKTKGRKGPQTRIVTLTCNTDPADIELTINADVE